MSVKEMNLPETKGFNTSWVMKEGDDYLIPIGNKEEQAIYRYNLESETVKSKMLTNGLPITFLKVSSE
jgi:hypothetical protein